MNIPKHQHSKCIATALSQAEQRCVRRGARFTELRNRVLELVLQSYKPIGAYTLLEQLREDGRSAAPPTVYRALDFLVEQGLVHRINSLNAFIGCFESAEGYQHGQFLICRRCGDTKEISHRSACKKMVDVLDKLAHEENYLIDEHIVELVGLCQFCQKTVART